MSGGIVILVGGRSTEHDASVHSYLAVLDDLERAGAPRVDRVLYVGRAGEIFGHTASWPRTYDACAAGAPMSFAALVAELERPPRRFVFSLLHGNEGEDGAWQGLAELRDLPGSFGSVFASAVGMNKWAQGVLACEIGGGECTLPATQVIARRDGPAALERALDALGDGPCILKPNGMGASLLTEMYARPDRPRMRRQLEEIFVFDSAALLQRYVRGAEYTVGCVDDGEGVIVLPQIRVRTARGFLGHHEKHAANAIGEVEVLTASTPLERRLAALSERIFRRMGFHAMCRFDYIVSDEERIFFLEANTMPGLSEHSAFPRMLRAAGFDRADLVRMSMASALRAAAREKILPYHIHGDLPEPAAARS